MRTPLALFPNGTDWANLRTAWVDLDLKLYFWNTVVIAAGSWAIQMVVAVTGGYALAILRPRYGRFLYGLVLMTMFVPAVVLLVPLYLTVLDLPVLHLSLVNSWWGAILPAGASAFNVALVKRFFDNLPHEVLDAARVDGAGPYRLFWYVVLPMSRPVLGVVSVFAVLAAWKDFIWPLVVLPDPAKQPLSVRLPRLAGVTELDVFLAALLISCSLPIVFFLVFQRFFLRGGLEGAVKGERLAQTARQWVVSRPSACRRWIANVGGAAYQTRGWSSRSSGTVETAPPPTSTGRPANVEAPIVWAWPTSVATTWS